MEPEMYRGFGVPSFGVLDRPIWWVKTPKGTSSERILSIDAIVRRIPQNRVLVLAVLETSSSSIFFTRDSTTHVHTFCHRDHGDSLYVAIFGWT